MRQPADLLLRHAHELLTMAGPPSGAEALGVVADGAVAIRGDRIIAVGPTPEVEAQIQLGEAAVVLDAHDAVVAPGLVDAHTHALFTGDRAHEFTMRLAGASYRDIAAQGGGIAASVRAVRGADDDTLRRALATRLERMRAFGTTTVEVKSGYALDTAHELRCLRVIRSLGAACVPTFLPLHAVPPELRHEPDGRARFLATVRNEMLPAVLQAGLARFVDAYVDGAGFSVAEARPVLEAARRGGLGLRLHVGQFDDVGGAELAAELGASSADHLEHLSDAGARAMAQAGVVAVLLPGAAYSLGQPLPDARRLRALGLQVALATDCNPGTSYTENLPLMASFGVRQMGLTTVEAWQAITCIPARSLGLDDVGQLVPGARADLCVLDLASWEALPYHFGGPLARLTLAGGRLSTARWAMSAERDPHPDPDRQV